MKQVENSKKGGRIPNKRVMLDLIGIIRWGLTHHLGRWDCEDQWKKVHDFFKKLMEVHLPSYNKYKAAENPPAVWNDIEHWKCSNLQLDKSGKTGLN